MEKIFEEIYNNSKKNSVEVVSTPTYNKSDAEILLKTAIKPLETFGIDMTVFNETYLIDGAYKIITHFSLTRGEETYADHVYCRNDPSSVIDVLKGYLNKFGIYVYAYLNSDNKYILSNEFLSKEDIKKILEK